MRHRHLSQVVDPAAALSSCVINDVYLALMLSPTRDAFEARCGTETEKQLRRTHDIIGIFRSREQLWTGAYYLAVIIVRIAPKS